MRACALFLTRIRDLMNLSRRRRAIRRAGKADSPLRLIIGAAHTAQDGWIATDRDVLDATNAQAWAACFVPGSIDRIMAEHVWEHLTEDDAKVAARNAFTFLKPGGTLRLAVPDALHPDPAYIEATRPGGTGPGADDHKVHYTHETLSALLQQAGFRVRALEYFDEAGDFHAEPWDEMDGRIIRSIRFDPRNGDGKPNYTSVIVDGIKV